MLYLLTRIRRGDDLMSISCDHPELTAAQLSLSQTLQAQEKELNRLYKELQSAEGVKMNLERALTSSLLSKQSS